MTTVLRLRSPYLPAIVGVGSARVGEDVWVPVYMKVASLSAAEHMAIPVGAVIHFAVQYGFKPEEDQSDMLVLRGRVDVAREPYSTDDLVYNVTFLDVVKSWDDMTPGIPMPTPGQMFVVSVNHVMEVESLPSVVPPPPTPTVLEVPPPTEEPRPEKASPSDDRWPWPWVGLAVGAAILVGIGAVLLGRA